MYNNDSINLFAQSWIRTNTSALAAFFPIKLFRHISIWRSYALPAAFTGFYFLRGESFSQESTFGVSLSYCKYLVVYPPLARSTPMEDSNPPTVDPTKSLVLPVKLIGHIKPLFIWLGRRVLSGFLTFVFIYYTVYKWLSHISLTRISLWTPRLSAGGSWKP